MEPQTGGYVAFFDLDKTILNANSGSVLVSEARRRGLISPSELLNIIYLSWMFRLRLKDTLSVVIRIGKRIKGIPVEGLTELAEYIVSNYLINAIRPEISYEIGFHRSNNAAIVILSSAIIQICKPLGSYIGADDVICTVLQTRDGLFTGSAEGSFCIGNEKKMRLIKYCETKKCNLNDVFYYSDSITDLSSLDIVGHPVCVKPDKRLARIARSKGWRII
jgi:HAD superfamily hydrolase (TIGR01490 family)